MDDAGKLVETAEELTGPVVVPVEAYISADYVTLERDRLWRKVWLQACRLEEILEVGAYVTYDILDDSVIILRQAIDRIGAFYNVCSHRGRRLIDTPPGEKNAHGEKIRFTCGFHGWVYDLEGHCSFIPEMKDWQGSLGADRTRLGPVQVDTWGGWVWINLDPDAGPLLDYLEPAASMLDPFQLENMRPRWRRWIEFDCNWKVAMEAFAEVYHVEATHPEFMAFGDFKGWARTQELHSNIGYEAPQDMDENQAKLRIGSGDDPRRSTADMQTYIWEHVNTNTTSTLVDAAVRLPDELPEGTAAPEVLKHWLESARRDDAARGVIWPVVDPRHTAASGTSWQIFPNFQIGHAVNNALCYSARPNGYDPDKCIFEVSVYELYPKGEEPFTKWTYTERDDPAWGTVLVQDFNNMAAVQKGLKTGGFRGCQPNPFRERSIANLHRNLARYVGTGAPRAASSAKR